MTKKNLTTVHHIDRLKTLRATYLLYLTFVSSHATLLIVKENLVMDELEEIRRSGDDRCPVQRHSLQDSTSRR